ncbi:MAG TPA: VTT domain-containing protein [Sandaracinaceae bacterium LLY-WYZ-13_1]|nr:VTT domain-containing protein [Sandaracinaceae bacterium LLY-WYZ-13_1]
MHTWAVADEEQPEPPYPREADAGGAGGEPAHETVVDEETDPPAKANRWRLLLLAALFFGSLAVARWTGIADEVDVASVRDLMQAAGVWGFLLFVVLFAVGELMHIPGIVFMGAASIAYGPVLGSVSAYTGALASVVVSFFVVRGLGGQQLANLRWKWARKVFGRLETHPVRTVATLRLLMWVSPPLNYGLAMSKIRFREYLIGSALGLLIPVPILVIFFDRLGTWLL